MTLLTVLNYSGGKQSSCILWMVLRGEIKRPENFVVMTADPGMENSTTYEYNRMMFAECEKAGIEAVAAPGPNLYEDLIAGQSASGNRARLDNPPYWTLGLDGHEGMLLQKCTREYKISPMNRAVRRILERDHGIHVKGPVPPGSVEKWIGFSSDEQLRVKPPLNAYERFRYPLIEMQMSNRAVSEYYAARSLPVPERSVCNACFANGVDVLREMHANRPGDWAAAVRVDEAVRDSTAAGIIDRVFVSRTRKPLRVLAQNDFKVDVRQVEMFGDNDDQWSCDSGVCFV